MSEAPAQVWLRPSATGLYFQTHLPNEPDAVRYVRADVYEAVVERHNSLMERMGLDWPCHEPVGTDYPR